MVSRVQKLLIICKLLIPASSGEHRQDEVGGSDDDLVRYLRSCDGSGGGEGRFRGTVDCALSAWLSSCSAASLSVLGCTELLWLTSEQHA